jgi:hypothetical protein
MTKIYKAGLLDSVVGSYDQTKTTIQGRVASKTIDGGTVLGPPVSKFLDIFTDGAATPLGTLHASPNGRLLVLGALATGVGTLHLYDFNYTTGASAYVGRINFVIPNTAATTFAAKGVRIHNDGGNTGWRIALAATGSVLINGGVFVLNNIDKADFVQVSPPTIPFATATDQKAVYFTQLSGAIGAGQLETSLAGLIYNSTDSKLYAHNGVSATHQYYVRDMAATNMTYVPSAATITVATPGVVTSTAHGFAANDPVVFIGGTVPTGLVLGTVYFVRNPATNTFEVSATSGGASITTTGSAGTTTVGRAFGTTTSTVLHRTGNLPALAGGLLNVDSENSATPVSAPINGGILDGNECAFFATASNLYLGLLSELTNGATTWPSLTTSNLLGTVNQITAPSPTFAGWDNTIDSAIYVTNTSKVVVKKVENNVIGAIFGALNNDYYEGFTFDTVELGLATVINIAQRNGWLFMAGGTIGQRGIIAVDMSADAVYDDSFIVTKVFSHPNAVLSAYATIEKLYQHTGNICLMYRTSGFGSIGGGWIEIMPGVNPEIPVASQIQFKILFRLISEGSSAPAQIQELLYSIENNSGVSDNWEYSFDNSSSGSPTRVGFRLKTAYATSVPQLFFRWYDTADTLMGTRNTVADDAEFEYSSNDGVSWSALGTIPNTVGTLIRYNFASPPGVKVRPGLRES